MAVSIRALLAREEFALRLLSVSDGGERLRARLAHPLTWGYSTDLLDPTPFLRGGELVLTTGQQLRGGDDVTSATRAYVARLDAGGAVGLVYTLPEPSPAWEAVLRDACRQAALPLMQAPFATPFIAISEAISTGRDDPEREAERRVLRAHHALTLAALERDGVRAIVRELALLLGGSVLVRSASGRVLAQAPLAARPAWVDAFADEVVGEAGHGGRRAAGARQRRQNARIAVGHLLRAPSTQSVVGALVLVVGVVTRSAGEQRERRMLVNTAIAMIQLSLDVRPPEALEVDEVGQAGARALLAGEPVTGLSLLRHAGLLPDRAEADADQPVTVVCGPRSLPQGLGGVRVRAAADRSAPWLMMFGAPDDRLREEVVAAGAVGLADVPARWVPAAARLARTRLTAVRPGRGEWRGLDALLLGRAVEGEALAAAAARQVRARAQAAERAHPGQRLAATFLVWWESGLSWRRAAETLGVHRNTVMRRVRALARALGRDLEHDQDARAFVRLALAGE